MRNMKIGKRIVLTVVLIEVLFCMAGVVGIFVTDNINSSYSDTLVNYGFSGSDVGEFNTEFGRCQTAIRDVLLETDGTKIQASSDAWDKFIAQTNTCFANLNSTMVSKEESSDYSDIKGNLTAYQTVCGQIIALAKQNKKTEAAALLSGQAQPIADKIQTSADSLASEKKATGHAHVADLSSQGEKSDLLLISVFALVILGSLVLAIRIARSISKPVNEMVRAADRMADGDLSARVEIDSKDEIGQLGKAFGKSTQTIKATITDMKTNLSKIARGDLNIAYSVEYEGDFAELKESMRNIVRSLNDTLTQIQQASEQVSSGSEQVSDGAQALAQGATEQASSIEELSASIEEISAHIKNNTEHVTGASSNVSHVRSEIEISNRQMNEMVAAMSQISNSSGEIGKIIQTIEDIAFQTNILALNAAVEAARAGAAGKGFAVVADEVRNLASKSAEAAKNTTALIENSMSQVQRGTKIADETAKSLLRVVESAKIVSEKIEKIAEASQRQSDAIEQITGGIEQVSGVVQNNSATAEESAAASEELSSQAKVMKELVDKFHLSRQY